MQIQLLGRFDSQGLKGGSQSLEPNIVARWSMGPDRLYILPHLSCVPDGRKPYMRGFQDYSAFECKVNAQQIIRKDDYSNNTTGDSSHEREGVFASL